VYVAGTYPSPWFRASTNTERSALVFAPRPGEHPPVTVSWIFRTAWAMLCMTSALSAAPPAPHPEPRVIVNVVSVRGPHAPRDVQRAARLAWGRIIRCYKSNDNGAKGRLELELRISKAGSVAQVRVGPATLDSAALVRCLADTMNGLAMPSASADSVADIEIQVAPGDRV
jgi:hypothetical protein